MLQFIQALQPYMHAFGAGQMQAEYDASIAEERARQAFAAVGGGARANYESMVDVPNALPPMARLALALSGNVASAISGNPHYAQTNAGLAESADNDRRQALRMKASAAMESARDNRAVTVQAQFESARQLADAAAKAGEFARAEKARGDQDKASRELMKLSEEAQVRADERRHNYTMQEESTRFGHEKILSELRREPDAITGDPTIDRALRIASVKNRLYEGATQAWTDAVKSKATKAKTLEKFIAENPTIGAQINSFNSMVLPAIAKKQSGETAQAWTNRLLLSGATPEQIQNFGKAEFPGEPFTVAGQEKAPITRGTTTRAAKAARAPAEVMRGIGSIPGGMTGVPSLDPSADAMRRMLYFLFLQQVPDSTSMRP